MVYGEEIIVADGSQVRDGHFYEGLRLTRCTHEFDFDGCGRMHVHDRAHVATTQAMVREVALQDYGIKFVQGHSAPPGNAVTKRGTSSPDRTIQTETSDIERPVGP